jgi:chorismate mutase
MSEYSPDDLVRCREQIDSIDVKMMELLNERTKIVERIGSIKRALAMPIYEPRREDQVLQNVLAHNRGPLEADAIRRVFERIMDEMRTLQQKKMQEARERSTNNAHQAP